MMNKHIQTHPGYEQPQTDNVCDKCDFVGKNLRSMQYHQKKHLGKIFPCDNCDFSTSTLEQLKSHFSNKHGQLQFNCDFCEFKFPVKWRLKQHTERRHSDQKVNYEIKQKRIEKPFDFVKTKITKVKAENNENKEKVKIDNTMEQICESS